MTSKVVVMLGRFRPEEKVVLNEIRQELTNRDYCPVMFDFEKPASRDFIETVSLLAHMSRFIIADFTDARIVLEEVPHIVRNIVVPVLPLLREDAGDEPVTLSNLIRLNTTVLETRRYSDMETLCANFDDVIRRAEEKAAELQQE